MTNTNTKVRSFKSSESIQKKEGGGPDCTVSNNKFRSDLASLENPEYLNKRISREFRDMTVYLAFPNMDT